MDEMIKKFKEECEKYKKKAEEYKKEAEEYKKEAEDAKNKIKEKEEEYKKKEDEIKEEKLKLKEREENVLKLENNPEVQRTNRISELKKKVDEFIKTNKININDEIEELQKILSGIKSFIPEIYYLRSSFDYNFGDKIENENFIDFMKKGLSTLYSDVNNRVIVKNVFNKIKDIINDFLYIPMLEDNTLCEFKKHTFLGAVSSQINGDDYSDLFEYIFYTNKYFNESNFKEIAIIFQRNSKFVKIFPSYGKDFDIHLDLETLKTYIFSETIKEAYLEMCKDVFGKNAKFVNMDNIEKSLELIYNEIVQNIKYVKLEKDN